MWECNVGYIPRTSFSFNWIFVPFDPLPPTPHYNPCLSEGFFSGRSGVGALDKVTFQVWDLMMAIRIGRDGPSYSLSASF